MNQKVKTYITKLEGMSKVFVSMPLFANKDEQRWWLDGRWCWLCLDKFGKYQILKGKRPFEYRTPGTAEIIDL